MAKHHKFQIKPRELAMHSIATSGSWQRSRSILRSGSSFSLLQFHSQYQ